MRLKQGWEVGWRGWEKEVPGWTAGDRVNGPAQGNQSLSRELRARALCPGLEARFPARRREERGCGPVTLEVAVTSQDRRPP